MAHHAMTYPRGAVCVCVDSASPAADAVYDVAAAQAAGAHAPLIVLHVAVSADEDASLLREHFSVKSLSRFAAGHWFVAIEQLPAGAQLRDYVLKMVSGLDASLVVMGYTGSHAPGEAASIMGSSADLSLRAGHTPTLLVKSYHRDGIASDAAPGEVVHAVCVDGSAQSLEALAFAAHLWHDATHPRRIVALHAVAESVKGEEAHEEVASAVRAFAAAEGLRGVTVVRAPLEGASTVAHALVSAANDAGATLLVLSVDGRGSSPTLRSNELGRVCDAVVRLAHLHVLCYQRHWQVVSGGGSPMSTHALAYALKREHAHIVAAYVGGKGSVATV